MLSIFNMCVPFSFSNFYHISVQESLNSFCFLITCTFAKGKRAGIYVCFTFVVVVFVVVVAVFVRGSNTFSG